MSQKYKAKIYYANVNVNLMVEIKNWTKRGIMINVDVSAKMYEHNNAYEEDYI